MSLSYRDPRVAAAQATSKKTVGNPLLRILPGGAIELVTTRRGRALRYQIDDTGHVQLLDTGDRSRLWLLGRRVILLGFAVVVVAWFSGAFFGWEDDTRGVALVVLAVLLWWTGGAIQSRAYSRIERSFNPDDGWFELKALVRLPGGEPPVTWLTLPQLRAVEELASARGNMAAVRLEAGGDAVEVVTNERRFVERHRVASSGDAILLDSANVGSRAQAQPWNRYGGKKDDWALVNLNEPAGE